MFSMDLFVMASEYALKIDVNFNTNKLNLGFSLKVLTLSGQGVICTLLIWNLEALSDLG